MKLTDKLIKMNDGSLNSLGQLTKDGLKVKKKNKKKVVIIEGTKLPDEDKLIKAIKKQKTVLDAFDKRIHGNDEAIKIIAYAIFEMINEVEQSTAGKRAYNTEVNPEDNKGYMKTTFVGNKSDFPAYVKQIFGKQSSKANFFSTIRGGKSDKFSDIVKEATGRVIYGYTSTQGHNGPDEEFQNKLDGVPF